MEKEYWDNRWVNQQLGWDVGHVSRPLKEFFDKIEDKSLKILIPGAGNSYEAEYLNNNGFTNVWVVDISAHAIASFQERCPTFPKDRVLNEDFFKLNGSYDLIVEQTFFCSLHPERRVDYVNKMKQLLAPHGRLVGVLFDCSFDAGPPFGGDKNTYMELFQSSFAHIKMEPCFNSIKPRLGTELWIDISM